MPPLPPENLRLESLKLAVETFEFQDEVDPIVIIKAAKTYWDYITLVDTALAKEEPPE